MKTRPNPTPESPLVTTKEVTLIRELESVLDSIQGHLEVTRSETEGKFKQTFSRARAAYVETPTTPNFENCVELVLQRDRELLFVRGGHLKNVIEVALKAFFHEKFLPLVTPIIERNLNSALVNLTEVTKQENERHKELFGSPVENSTLINAARQRFVEMKTLKVSLSNELEISQMQQLLRRLGAWASE